MSFNFNFCRTCGSAAKQKFSGWYDHKTGEKIMFSVCSKDECHTGHDERPHPRRFWPFQPDWICSRCGQTGYHYYGL